MLFFYGANKTKYTPLTTLSYIVRCFILLDYIHPITMPTRFGLRSSVGVGVVLLGLSFGSVGVAAQCKGPPSPRGARGFRCQTETESFDDPSGTLSLGEAAERPT